MTAWMLPITCKLHLLFYVTWGLTCPSGQLRIIYVGLASQSLNSALKRDCAKSSGASGVRGRSGLLVTDCWRIVGGDGLNRPVADGGIQIYHRPLRMAIPDSWKFNILTAVILFARHLQASSSTLSRCQRDH